MAESLPSIEKEATASDAVESASKVIAALESTPFACAYSSQLAQQIESLRDREKPCFGARTVFIMCLKNRFANLDY